MSDKTNKNWWFSKDRKSAVDLDKVIGWDYKDSGKSGSSSFLYLALQGSSFGLSNEDADEVFELIKNKP